MCCAKKFAFENAATRKRTHGFCSDGKCSTLCTQLQALTRKGLIWKIHRSTFGSGECNLNTERVGEKFNLSCHKAVSPLLHECSENYHVSWDHTRRLLI